MMSGKVDGLDDGMEGNVDTWMGPMMDVTPVSAPSSTPHTPNRPYATPHEPLVHSGEDHGI